MFPIIFDSHPPIAVDEARIEIDEKQNFKIRLAINLKQCYTKPRILDLVSRAQSRSTEILQQHCF